MKKNNKNKVLLTSFNERWENYALKELFFDIKKGKKIHFEKIKSEGKYPVFGGNGIRGYADTYSHDGTFLIIGRQGKLCGNVNISYGKAYFTEHCIIIRAKENVDIMFLYYLLTKMNLNQYSDHSAQPGLSIKKLINLESFVPKYEEQLRVSTLLKNIDNIIVLTEKEITTYLKIKNKFLKKMFLTEEKEHPEIRFTGFYEKWKEKKIGDIMKVSSSKRINVSDWSKNEVKFLRVRDIVAIFKNQKEEKCLYISQKKYNEYSEKIGKVSKGDLLVTSIGTIGIPLLIKNDDPVYFKDSSIIWFKNGSNIDGNFFYYSFINKNVQNQIQNMSGGGNLSTFTINHAKNTRISVPSKKEQYDVGVFFELLDKLISLHEKELQIFKCIKKSFIQKIFIS